MVVQIILTGLSHCGVLQRLYVNYEYILMLLLDMMIVINIKLCHHLIVAEYF